MLCKFIGYDYTSIVVSDKSRGSAVGIATDYGLGDRGIIVQGPVVKNFHFSVLSRLALVST
jgi:hypothetical protein